MEIREFIEKYKVLIGFIILIFIAILFESGGFQFLFQGYLKEPRLWMCSGYYHSQFDGSDEWWERNKIIQNVYDAKLLGYDIHLDKTDYYIDNQGYVHRMCLYKATISRNGVVVWNSTPDVVGRTNTDYTKCSSSGGTGEVEGLRFAFGQVWNFAYSDCKRINSYFWIKVPKDKINISVSAKKIVNVNDSEKAEILLINNWNQDLKADIKAKVCTPTLIGKFCKEFDCGEKMVKGYSSTVAELNIPTQDIGKLTIIPIVHFSMPTEGIENLNYGSNDRTSVPITQIDYLDLGYIQGDSYSVEVVGYEPEPEPFEANWLYIIGGVIAFLIIVLSIVYYKI